MKNILLIILVFCSYAANAATDFQKLSELLYPKDKSHQSFVKKFFEIVELHKTRDPFLKGNGPSIQSYSLDKIRFAFMVNETDKTVDLIIFHWDLPVIDGLELEQTLTNIYSSKVYSIRGMLKSSIATQGDKNDELTNFSYLVGAQFYEAQVKSLNPTYKAPKDIIDWKPHPNYLDSKHPLRHILGTNALSLLSPDLKLLVQNDDELVKQYVLSMMKGELNYFGKIMGMMIHEMYHLKEVEDKANGLSARRDIPEDREEVINKLNTDSQLKALVATYAKIVFSIGDSLKHEPLSETEAMHLANLKVMINEIKKKYPAVWNFIWNYEYSEGFAEYSAAYSMTEGKVTTLEQQIEEQKTDGNNFTYRTGALGGLYLLYRFKAFPFSKKEDSSSSVWELILARSSIRPTTASASEIITKYKDYQFDFDQEIEYCIHYLKTTEAD